MFLQLCKYVPSDTHVFLILHLFLTYLEKHNISMAGLGGMAVRSEHKNLFPSFLIHLLLSGLTEGDFMCQKCRKCEENGMVKCHVRPAASV